jgi:hypothetical protein
MYPAYFRKGPVCIKRESSRTGKQVDLSQESFEIPFQQISTENTASFDALISDMEVVSHEVYERYLVLLHNKARYEARSFRELHHRSPEFSNSGRRRSYEA